MTLQTRLESLAQAVGADVKSLRSSMLTDRSQDDGRALRTFRGSNLGGSGNPTDILIVGASFEEGYGTTLMANGWPNVFRDDLRVFAQPKGLAGGGSVPPSAPSNPSGIGNYFGYSPYGKYTGGAVGTYADNPIIAATGTFTPTTTIGLGLRGLAAANGSSFTLEWFGTGIDLVYSTDPTFGSFTYAVDGATATTVNTAVATAAGQRVAVRGLVRGRHTIVVNTTVAGTGGAGVAHEGAVFYDGDEASGIRVWQAAKSGKGAQDFATSTGWVNSLQTWNSPDLVIINLGWNDWNNGRTATQIKTDLQTIITATKNRIAAIGAVTPSFVLMSSFSVASSGGATDTWANVVQAIYDIADADDDVCVFNYQHWFGKITETAISTRGGILVADGLHPTDSGAAIIGGAMAEFVLDSTERFRDVMRNGSQPAPTVNNASIADQAIGGNSDVYIVGSNCVFPAGARVKQKTQYRCRVVMSKTAAGTAAPVLNVRIGTAGTTADTSRAALTFAAQTAVVDQAVLDVYVTFRTVGAGTLATIRAEGKIGHALAATGFSTANESIAGATSSGFDSTLANLMIGLSVNAGVQSAWTVTSVQSELVNLA